jgi:lipid-A-disaccharide synthase
MVREMLAGSGLPVEVHVGRTPDVIESADACVAVSGSVGLELMCRLKPTVVVYKGSPVLRWLAGRLMTCEYISLVNLLAGEEVYPEYPTSGDESDAIARHVIEWLTVPAAKEKAVEKLRALRDRVAVPGACERAAEFLLSEINAAQREPVRLRPVA